MFICPDEELSILKDTSGPLERIALEELIIRRKIERHEMTCLRCVNRAVSHCNTYVELRSALVGAKVVD